MTRLAIRVLAVLLIVSGPLGSAGNSGRLRADASDKNDQDAIATARDLYASAAYEEALAVLNGLPPSSRPAEETRVIEQYRALCLLALGRMAEAEHAIETVVSGEPMYRPAAEVSPRLRIVFSDVRKRVLPGVVQEQYAHAKTEYDHKDFAAAANDFTKVLDVMNDPDLTTALNQPPLSDIRTLAIGFKALAVNAAAPPPLPPPPPPAPVAVRPEVPSVPQPPKVYTVEDPGVSPPVPLRQDLPPFPGNVPVGKTGMIEVLIDESGAVESVFMRRQVGPNYDSLALAAARNWRYRPATVNGMPVKFRKAVQVTVRPR
jgi:TonB family protein